MATSIQIDRPYLDSREASRILRVSRRTVQRRAAAVGAIRLGRDWLITPAQVARIAAAMRPIGKKSKKFRSRKAIA